MSWTSQVSAPEPVTRGFIPGVPGVRQRPKTDGLGPFDVCLGVLTAPVVALGVYKGCREAMGPGVGSTEIETSSQVQVDALTMKGSSKI